MHLKRGAAVGVLTIAVGLAAVPGLADAARTRYAPAAQARTFRTGAGHWKGSVTQNGPLCITPVTCPTVTPAFVPSGGRGGSSDGFLRGGISGLTTVLTTSSANFTSPPFRYRGVRGHRAKRLTFRMARRTDLGALLALPSAAASQTVQLLDVSRGKRAITLVKNAPLTNANRWAATKPIRVKPRRVKLGHRYRIRMIANYTTPIAALPASSVDYDNVQLVARRHLKHHHHPKHHHPKHHHHLDLKHHRHPHS